MDKTSEENLKRKKTRTKSKQSSRVKPPATKTKKPASKRPKRFYKLLSNPPEPVTRQSLMKWLSDTGWVEGLIGKRISPLDRDYFDDYVQECWVQILSVPPDKILEIWYRGKGKFVNYIKSIVANNIYSTSSPLYNNIRKGRSIERFLTDEQWAALDDTGESDYEISFAINDFDDNNRALHRGVDLEHCKTDDAYRIQAPEEIEIDDNE